MNLLFEKRQDRYDYGGVDFYISGMLFRTFSEIDLNELLQVCVSLKKRMPKIDQETIVCTFEGHTIFSIFQEHIAVYEQILSQLKDQEFENEQDGNGDDAENSFLRRLYRVLNMPVDDWRQSARAIREQQ